MVNNTVLRYFLIVASIFTMAGILLSCSDDETTSTPSNSQQIHETEGSSDITIKIVCHVILSLLAIAGLLTSEVFFDDISCKLTLLGKFGLFLFVIAIILGGIIIYTDDSEEKETKGKLAGLHTTIGSYFANMRVKMEAVIRKQEGRMTPAQKEEFESLLRDNSSIKELASLDTNVQSLINSMDSILKNTSMVEQVDSSYQFTITRLPPSSPADTLLRTISHVETIIGGIRKLMKGVNDSVSIFNRPYTVYPNEPIIMFFSDQDTTSNHIKTTGSIVINNIEPIIKDSIQSILQLHTGTEIGKMRFFIKKVIRPAPHI